VFSRKLLLKYFLQWYKFTKIANLPPNFNIIDLVQAKASCSIKNEKSGHRFGNISTFEHKKQPPQPPLKTPTLTYNVVMGVKEKYSVSNDANR